MSVQSSDDEPMAEVAATDRGDAERLESSPEWLRTFRHKVEEWVARGFLRGHASGLAQLEARIENWPSGWGDDLVVLIYGDFEAPPVELHFPELGITIEPGKVTNSFIQTALCVLKARVKIPAKSIAALIEAVERVNLLLGAVAALNWGNAGIGWTSYVTNPISSGGMSQLEPDPIRRVVEALRGLHPEVARRVRSALYWIREPRQLLMEGYRSDALRVYAGYWNAFECLVEAVLLLRPQQRITRAEKRRKIDAFVAARNGRLDVAAVAECYRSFVDPGFRAKAIHALGICFPPLHAAEAQAQCFSVRPAENRLYNIRNAINHGDVDADNPSELLRIDDRHEQLRRIVFGMLEYILRVRSEDGTRARDHAAAGTVALQRRE